MNKVKNLFPAFLSGLANSYTQIFFSDSRIFAVILAAITFFDFQTGFSGLMAVVISNSAAYLIGFNREAIRRGFYGFNSLLVGLGLGVYYQPGIEFFIVVAFASLLTLFLTLMVEGVIGKYGLPYLSMSFLLATWLVTLASRQFTALHISERGIFITNEIYQLGGQRMVSSHQWLSDLNLPEPLRMYLTSLGAIFFQYHLFAGILVAIGLLIHSRIAFMLSLTGFFSAWAYYRFIGADLHELTYSYIGFNFILTSIAVGGFFIIPSRWSFLWVILLTPLISIILTSTQAVFSLMQLSVFSLPFNMVVLMFLYALKFRERFYDKPELVSYQQYSPEKNLYAHVNYKARFGRALYFPFILPFWGEWKVTQGRSGKHTHQGAWSHAWDFEVANDEGRTYSGDGTRMDDYYAYNKPVTAPADGQVEEITDHVEDNTIGSMDLENNWGNTIILRHADQLFSKLSHLKKGSFRVKQGDSVKKGQVIAACGNSGRSPVPHLHFQLQGTPYIGSPTLDYPMSHFIRHKDNEYELVSWEAPEENGTVSNISRNASLEKAFRFIPGQEFHFTAETDKRKTSQVDWEVRVDALNHTYLFCERSGSRAWFRNDGDIHYFTHFDGDRSSVLFRFYLGAYKIMLGYYPGLLVQDQYPANAFNHRLAGFFQDVAAPFVLFTKAEYRLRYESMTDAVMQTGIQLRSEVRVRVAGRLIRKMDCTLHAGASGLEWFAIRENGIETMVRLSGSR